LVLVAATIVTPITIARAFVFPLAWLWPILIWSAIGNREIRYAVHQLIFSSAHPLGRQFPAVWIAGVAVTLVATSGIGIRALIAGDPHRLIAWLVGVAFVPSLAAALGTWSRSSRLFEIVYLFWWYAGPMNAITEVDFTGNSAAVITPTVTAFYAGAAVVLLALAFWGRRRQLVV
jgi:hypothetical protein